MSSPTWMPLYIADYLRDTAHLRAAESGAYLHLIMAYWAGGKLPTDDRQLATIAKMTLSEWRRARPTLEAFFGTGFSSHKRIDEELAHAADVISKRRSAAQQRHSKSNANASSHADANALQVDTQSPSPRKKDIAPDGASTPVKLYAFEDGIIRLTEKDFGAWERSFPRLDLRSELMSLSKWAVAQGPANWFHAVKGALAKRNREVKAAAENAARGGNLPLTPSGNRWPDGIT